MNPEKLIYYYAKYGTNWKEFENWFKEKKAYYPADILGMTLPEPRPTFMLTPKGIKQRESGD
jgi:hypothetical protein